MTMMINRTNNHSSSSLVQMDEDPNHHKKPQTRMERKTVSFATETIPTPTTTARDEPDSTDAPGAPPLMESLTEAMCQTLWYQKDELAAMKQRVRQLILHTIPGDLDDVAGLGRFTHERSRHKRSAIYYTLAAHEASSGDAHYTELVSQRCTAWARHWAREEGFANYCDVYGDPLEALLSGSNWEEALEQYNHSDRDHHRVSSSSLASSSSIKRKATTSSIEEDRQNDDDLVRSCQEQLSVSSPSSTSTCGAMDRRVRPRLSLAPITTE